MTPLALPLLCLLACGLSGCATSALWENHAFDGFNEPARPANLKVFKTQGDWLVQYDEVNENNERIRRRAYYLKPNRDLGRRKPRFVKVAKSLSFPPAHVVVSADGRRFTLYDEAANLGTYELPVYPAQSGRVKQVLLTPCTLVADATIVGGVIALYWWSAGAPGLADCR